MMSVRKAFLTDAARIAAVHVNCCRQVTGGADGGGLPRGWFDLRISIGRTGTGGRGVVFDVFIGGSAGTGIGTAVGGGGVGDTWRTGSVRWAERRLRRRTTILDRFDWTEFRAGLV